MQFLNPWGLLALLGIPAVLFIHALRRSPKTYLTNTLFLIEAKLRDPGGGRKLRRLRRSAQLWLRLLLVGLITWVLARPVTVREDSTQRIVLVIDVSASMSASKANLIPALRAAAKPWLSQTAHIEWIALSSLPDAPPIHRGWDDFELLLDRLEDLEPRRGTHDPHPAINLALGLASAHGRVVFVTDHIAQPAVPGIGVLSLGSPVQNVGWCGVDSSPDGSWKAILRNYGNSAQQRRLTQADGSQVVVELGAGEWRSFSGVLPSGSARATLSLADDEFTLDDELHLVRPRRKPLTWASVAPPPAFERLFAAGGLERATDPAAADIELRPNDLAPANSDHARLLIPTKPSADAPYVRNPATATAHALTEGLIFDGLLWRHCAPLDPPAADDSVLLWASDAAVAILRDQGSTLELGFHPDLSNLDRVPSVLVMIQRWLDSLRETKVAAESFQLSTGDRFFLAADPDGDDVIVTSEGGTEKLDPASPISLFAPEAPGPLTITQGDTALVDAAVNFIDPIESDFSRAEAGFTAPPAPTSTVQKATLPDRFSDLWLLLAIAALLLSWRFPEANAPIRSSAN